MSKGDNVDDLIEQMADELATFLPERDEGQDSRVTLGMARAALTAITASGHEVVKPELGKLSAAWLAEAQRHPEAARKFALDLINATGDGPRLELVELPEPTHGPDGERQFSWHTGTSVISARPDGRVWEEDFDMEPHEAQENAAALLAAAKAAEEAK